MVLQISVPMSRKLVTFHDFISTIILFSVAIAATRNFPFSFESLNPSFRMFAYPDSATLCFAFVLIIFVNRLFSSLDHFTFFIIPHCGSMCCNKILARARFYFVLSIVLSCITLPVFLSFYFNLGKMLLPLSLYLLSVDVNLICDLLKYGVLYRSRLSTNNETKAQTFVTHSSSEFIDWMRPKAFNLLVKFLLLSLGATSGYRQVDYIFQLVLLYNLGHFLTVLYILPLSTKFMLLLSNHAYTKTENKTHTRQNLKSPSLDRSCIPKYSYIERSHVDVQSVLKVPNVQTSASGYHGCIKIAMLLGLLILHRHSRSRFIDIDMISPHQNFSTTQSKSTHNFILTLVEESILLPVLISEIFKYIDLNLLFFLLLGLLLCNREQFFTPMRNTLLNLHLTTSEQCLPQIDELADNIDSEKPHERCANSNLCDLSNHTITKTNRVSERSHEQINQVFDLQTCMEKVKEGNGSELSDSAILNLLATGHLKTRQLEAITGDPNRAVQIRRRDLTRLLTNPHILERLPSSEYDYRFVNGQCCEEVIGYVPIPVGKIGPLLLDGYSHYVPLATTEGCLVASTNRGCRALFLAGGVKSVVFRDQMSRAPVVWFPSAIEVVTCIAWIESSSGYELLKSAFEQTSAHVNLLSIFANPAGNYLHIRFSARTGNAMGMNMVSKATDSALHTLRQHFVNMQVISLSGNMCTDKKPAAINTILGRGKSVIAEARLPAPIVAQVLHTTPSRLARLALVKNWTGSALAGSVGSMGSNAHAANLVAGMFAATGQDLAQVVESSACLTQFEVDTETDALLVSVTMPCIEVGTIGGGTRLPPQRSCLDLLNLSVDRPTEHLARLVASVVLAGELSLMAALDTDDLVKAHLRLNRCTASPISNYQPPVSKGQPESKSCRSRHTSLAASDSVCNSEFSHYVM